MYTENKGK